MASHLRQTCDYCHCVPQKKPTSSPFTQVTTCEIDRHSPSGSQGSSHNSPRLAKNGHVGFSVCPNTDSQYEMREINKAKYGYAEINKAKDKDVSPNSLKNHSNTVTNGALEHTEKYSNYGVPNVVTLNQNDHQRNTTVLSAGHTTDTQTVPCTGNKGYTSIPLIVTTEA